jgi:effector-binding domain-containing protein
MSYDIDLVDLQEQHTATVRGHVPMDGIAAFLGEAFGEVARVTDGQGLRVSGAPFGRYRPTGDGAMDVEAGFPVRGAVTPEARVEPATLPGGLMARTLHVGDYANVGAAYEAVQTWLIENGYVGGGEPWESYLDGPDVPKPRTELFFPCHQMRPVHA